jgi:hypothetical protein
MLPKLADLWDQAGVIFLMATNHRRHLDPAVTRANRFDLLLCVAPPPWSRKKSADKLKNVLKIEAADEVASKLEQQVDAGSSTERQLDLFTVSELGTFFDHLKRANKVHSLVGALEKYKNRDQFSKEVAAWATNVITLREGTPTKAEYDVDQDADVNASRRQYYRKERKKEKDKKQKPRHNLSKTTGAPKKRRRKRSRTAVRTSKH